MSPTEAIERNYRAMLTEQASADLAALTTRLIAERAAAMSEAAGWRAKYEHLAADVDDHRNRAAFYKVLAERLAEDVARLSTEIVRVRGISSLAQVIPGPAVPEPGSIDEALKEQQEQQGEKL